ncbi:hypothetical protein ACFWNK_01250 [Streptomyces sp. NPDC058417]|uniref:hypothetical protein n=1 Tax=unclassified Streptomyces TaxID=2593676 RepID=UPI00364AB161
MGKRKLRSVLAAAFATAVAFGALSGLAGAKSDALADSSWGRAKPVSVVAGDSSWGLVRPTGEVPGDSSWGVVTPVSTNDSSWG